MGSGAFSPVRAMITAAQVLYRFLRINLLIPADGHAAPWQPVFLWLQQLNGWEDQTVRHEFEVITGCVFVLHKLDFVISIFVFFQIQALHRKYG